MKIITFNLLMGLAIASILFGCSSKTVLLKQSSRVKSQEQLNKEREIYTAKFKSLGLQPNWENRFYNAGINLDKYDELLAAGVDLKEYPSSHYLVNSLFAENIITGKVQKVEYDSSKVAFHTIWYIEVDRYVKSVQSYFPDVIKIVDISGPRYGRKVDLEGNIVSEGLMWLTKSAGIPNLEKGDTALFYLEHISGTEVYEKRGERINATPQDFYFSKVFHVNETEENKNRVNKISEILITNNPSLVQRKF